MQDNTLQRRWDLDEWCDRFEREWQSNSEPSLSHFLSEWQGPEKEKLFRHLLELELDYRAKRGEKIAYDRYQREFPEFASILNEVLRSFQGDDTDHTQSFGTNPKSPKKSEAAAPQRLGNYEILAPLGKGGMGVVYKARQSGLNRTVALKTIRSGEFASPEELTRFRAEAEAAAALSHPAIVPVYEVGEDQGRVYFSMELVEGESLAAASAERVFTPMEAARVVEASSRAIAYAHEKGIVHRDLKPGNILLDLAGNPHIMDFGLAKSLHVDRELTATGQVIGTPNYMPPEQARGDVAAISATSDVYSLGAVLYRLITGRPPFQAATLIDTLRDVLETEALAPSKLARGIPRDLDTICLKCLEKSPSARYASAAELAEELARFQRHEPIKARPISRVERGIRWCRRNRLTAALSAGTIASVLVGTIVAAVLYRDAAEKDEKRIAAEIDAGEKKRTAERAERERGEAESISSAIDYAVDIERACQAMNISDHEAALALLARLPSESRNWEYRYLEHAMRTECLQIPVPGELSFPISLDAVGQLAQVNRIAVADGNMLRQWHSGMRKFVAQDRIASDRKPAGVIGFCASTFTKPGTQTAIFADGRVLTTTSGKPNEAGYHDLNTGIFAVVSARFTPMGMRAMVASCDPKNAIRFWDIEQSKALPPPELGDMRVSSIAISPDGSHYAAVELVSEPAAQSNGESQGANVSFNSKSRIVGGKVGEPGPPIWNFAEIDGPVFNIAIDEKNESIFAACGWRTLRLWPDGNKATLPEHARGTLFALKPGGFVLATSDQGRANLIALNTLKVYRTLELPGREIQSMRFSQDGSQLLISSNDQTGKFALHDWKLEAPHHLFHDFTNRTGSVRTAFVSAKNKRAALIREKSPLAAEVREGVAVIDTTTGNEIRFIDPTNLASIDASRISEGGRFLTLVSGELLTKNEVKEKQRGLPLNEITPEHWKEIAAAERWQEPLIIDCETGETTKWPANAPGELTASADTSADGLYSAAVSYDRLHGKLWLRIREMKRFEHVFQHELALAGQCVYRFSPQGDRFAFTDLEGIHIVELGSGEYRKLADVNDVGHSYASLAFNADGTRLAVGGIRQVEILELASGKTEQIIRGILAPVTNVAFSNDGLRLVTAGAGNSLVVWDWRNAKRLMSVPLEHNAWSQKTQVKHIEFADDADGSLIAVTEESYGTRVHQWLTSPLGAPLQLPLD